MLTPLTSSQWTFASAAHLLNRAGFGGTPDEIGAARAAGMEKTLESLLQPQKEPETNTTGSQSWTRADNFRSRLKELRQMKLEPEERREKVKQALMEQRDELLDLRLWWLKRMRSSKAPLLEKMTLFWHGHFATSMVKVRNLHWMWEQNETFRRYALGNFRQLLGAVSRDPAMMIYLDLAQSRVGRPNENWAREVMELFTLGLGNYTEEDVREAARAFTGYRINMANQAYRFVVSQHDSRQKRFLGRSGHFSGDDILDLIVEQPACARFIGRKIWRFFVEDEPPAEMVEAVAGALRRHGFELRPVLKEIFSSAEFYSPRVIRQQIKSPAQFLVQTCKLLETDLPPGHVTQTALQQLGQSLFAPPNVKGWDGGKAWISTSTLLFRYNFANYLVNGTGDHPNAPANIRRAPVDVRQLLPDELRDNPAALVSHLARRLYQGEPAPKQTETLLAYLKSRGPDPDDETIRHLLRLMMSTPQYQLT
jgi:uncharacterized protein (DUF1800 family)